METRICRICFRELPLEKFPKRYHREVGARPGRSGSSVPFARCLECVSAYNKRWLANETADQRAARSARVRENWFRSQYGISVADYDRMLAEQGGKCAACARPPTGAGVDGVLHVDHDHETGEVRGLLCGPCNKALGILRDDPNEIWNLLLYARRHQRALRLVA